MSDDLQIENVGNRSAIAVRATAKPWDARHSDQLEKSSRFPERPAGVIQLTLVV